MINFKTHSNIILPSTLSLTWLDLHCITKLLQRSILHEIPFFYQFLYLFFFFFPKYHIQSLYRIWTINKKNKKKIIKSLILICFRDKKQELIKWNWNFKDEEKWGRVSNLHTREIFFEYISKFIRKNRNQALNKIRNNSKPK